jgi:hypothetical protein
MISPTQAGQSIVSCDGLCPNDTTNINIIGALYVWNASQ